VASLGTAARPSGAASCAGGWPDVEVGGGTEGPPRDRSGLFAGVVGRATWPRDATGRWLGPDSGDAIDAIEVAVERPYETFAMLSAGGEVGLSEVDPLGLVELDGTRVGPSLATGLPSDRDLATSAATRPPRAEPQGPAHDPRSARSSLRELPPTRRVRTSQPEGSHLQRPPDVPGCHRTLAVVRGWGHGEDTQRKPDP
jgi:hypothetical protein